MTRSRDLPRVDKTCRACGDWVAECEVPVLDGALPMCWLCAHQVVDHGVALHAAPTARCECLPWEVYPRDVFAPGGAAQFEAKRDAVLARRSS